jgi:hypothetical protein
MNLLRLWCSITLLAAVGHAQQTWKVYCQGGPGIDFTDLPPAVAAAAPGDTILVWQNAVWQCPSWPDPGYGYTAPVIDKALSIVGLILSNPPTGTGVLPPRVALSGVVKITNLPAGQRVVLSNVSPGSLAPDPTGFEFDNCSGQILMDGSWFGSIGENNLVRSITNCANVFLHGCRIENSGTTMGITNSTVTMSLTSVTSVPPFAYFGYPYTQGVPGITLVNSTLTLTGSTVRGTDKYEWSQGPYFPTIFAQPGVLMDSSSLFIGPGTAVRGGWISGQNYTSAIRNGSPTPGLVHQDPRAVVGHHVQPMVSEYVHAAYALWAVANQNVGLYAVGPPDGFALLLFGDYQMSPFATPFGNLLLDPNAVTFVDLFALPATSGAVYREYFIPPSVRYGHAYGLQSLTLSPAGELQLGVPTAFAVAWENGRLP